MNLLGKGLLAIAIALLGAGEGAARAEAKPPTMVLVGGGTYRPLFPTTPADAAVAVRPFRLATRATTNGEMLAFVREHPEWRRDRVARVLAEKQYLSHWAAPDALGEGVDPEQPVVEVSWFAARAYCASQGLRLPTEAEWELAGSASRVAADGSSDAAWRTELALVYAGPMPSRLPKAGAGAPNFWGVRDLHGVVWEWVLDFDAAIAALSNGSDGLRFCGASGGASGGEATDFAAFERVALRSSLRAAYVTKNLGFRCAGDAPPPGGSS